MLTLGQKIKSARKELGLTQAELVGDRITRNQLSLIENGINNPSIPTLEFLAERLGRPVSYFLSDDDFLKHECISLITKCEHFNERGDYHPTVNNLENFLSSIEPEEFTYGDLLGKIYALLGEAYNKIGDKRAEEYLLKSIDYLDYKEHTIYLCKAYKNLGNVSTVEKTDDSDRMAEEYYSKANEVLSNITLDNIVLKLNVTYNLAQTQAKLNKYENLVPLIHEILQYSQKYKIYHNFGEFKMLLANAHAQYANYKDAVACILKAIEYFTFTSQDTSRNMCYTNLGVYYRLAKDYQNSLKYLDLSISYFKATDNHKPLTNAKAEKIKTLFFAANNSDQIKELIGEIFGSINEKQINKADLLTILAIINLENGEIDDSLNLFTNAEELFADKHDSEFIPYINLGLSKIYKHIGEWERAYQYLTKVNDSKFEIKRKINFE